MLTLPPRRRSAAPPTPANGHRRNRRRPLLPSWATTTAPAIAVDGDRVDHPELARRRDADRPRGRGRRERTLQKVQVPWLAYYTSMPTAQTTLDANESIEEAYPNDIRVIRVERENEPPLYRFEAPLFEETMEWEDKNRATLYAAVYVVADGFREEKTGKRGIPIEVHKAGQEAVISYLTTQPGMSIKWASRMFDLERQRIYEYRSRIWARADSIRSEHRAENGGKSD